MIGYLDISSAPAAEPLSVTEAKSHLQVEHSDDDTLITSLVKSVRQTCERHTNRALINQTWKWVLPCFPTRGDVPLQLPKPPLSSISGITYVDSNGDEQTWSSSLYQVTTPAGDCPVAGLLLPVYGQTWPSTRAETLDAVTITFVAGYGADSTSVPEDLRAGMLLLLGHLYRHRNAVNVGSSIVELPFGVNTLWAPYQWGQL